MTDLPLIAETQKARDIANLASPRFEPKPVHDVSGALGGVLYGPCPGCDAWQLEITFEDLASYGFTWWGIREETLFEHALECPSLADRARAAGIEI